jgi:predicted enzyme related to lactoylglutathione lyase
MSTRLINVIVDSGDPRALAEFWGGLLGWPVSHPQPGEVDLLPPPDDGCQWELVFVEVPEPKTVKNRLHLDLASRSADEQMAIVARAIELGAKRVDIGQRNVPWFVLADPEGNEFCVLESRPEYLESGAVAAVVVEAEDPSAQAEFWSAATGWPVARGGAELAALRDPDGRGPWLEFLRGAGQKVVKNRLHLDVAPEVGGSVRAEVERLTAKGASMSDLDQDENPWSVMVDPEGNEFCVLTPR